MIAKKISKTFSKIASGFSRIASGFSKIASGLVSSLMSKKERKGMSAAGAMVMVVGIVGLLIFGYLFYLNFAQGGLNSVTTVADGVGLILSGMLAAAGTYGKWK
jgi:hypothetical protein